MYRVAGLIGKSVSRRAWCRDHMHLQTPPLPASTSRADMLRLNRETAVLLLACQSGIRLSSRLEHKPSSTLKVRALGVEHNSRSEGHTSELQSLMRNTYAVFCLNTKNTRNETSNR